MSAAALHLVIIQIPINEVGYTLFNTGIGFVVNIPDQIADIGVGVGHVTSLQRQKVLLRCAIQAAFQCADVMFKVNGLVVTNVVYPIGCRAGCCFP